MISVIDNFLDKERFEHVRDSITDRTFTWRVGPSLSDKSRIIDPKLDIQCVRLMFAIGDTIEPELIRTITPLLKSLKIRSSNLLRVKANLVMCKEKPYIAGYHVDVPEIVQGKGMTGIYYINTNNGATLFENGDVVESIENRMVVFPNNLKHSAKYQTDTPTRIVINFNWLTEEIDGGIIWEET